MTTINQLSAVDTVSAGDLVPIFSTNNGDARKAAMSVLQAFILDNFVEDLTQSTEAIVDADLFAMYDISQSNSVKVTAALVRAYIQAQLFTSMTAGASVTAADKFAILDDADSTTKAITAAMLLAYMQANLTFPSTATLFQNYITQYAAPSSTGFTVVINNNSNNTHLILTPTAGFAAGAITLPAIANVIDKQEVLVNCTQQINALTINANGATAVTGEPAVIAADDFFRLRFDLSTSSWYRVG